MVQPETKGTAFRRTSRTDLDWIFTAQTERVVANDNPVAIADRFWQIDKTLPAQSGRRHSYNPRTPERRSLDPLWSPRRGKIHGAGRSNHRQQTGAPWKRRARGNRRKPTAGFLPFPQALGNPAKGARFPLFNRADDGFGSQNKEGGSRRLKT
jgi:hypothetical protein